MSNASDEDARSGTTSLVRFQGCACACAGMLALGIAAFISQRHTCGSCGQLQQHVATASLQELYM